MTLEDFQKQPFRNGHPAYSDSCFWFGAQPEWTTGEVLLASCYRALGLSPTAEGKVDLAEIESLPGEISSDALPRSAWEFIFMQALRGPSRPGERSARPQPQLVPVVPALANVAGVLGKPRNRWIPGNLALYTLASGTGLSGFAALKKQFGSALTTREGDDDAFAVFLEDQLSAHFRGRDAARPHELNRRRVQFREDRREPYAPAEVFALDLRELLLLKRSLTRRQWCALVESALRLGLVTHVLWICRLNVETWQMALEVLAGQAAPGPAEIENRLWQSHVGPRPFLDGGQQADPHLRRQVEEYTTARLGINLLLLAIDEFGGRSTWQLPREAEAGWSTGKQISCLLSHLMAHRGLLGPDPKGWAVQKLGEIVDAHPSKVSAESGPPSNLFEFLSYALRRRVTAEVSLQQHDQGYLLVKTSGKSNSPWVVRPGPVMLLAMCHATCKSMAGAPATIQDLARHFSYYGVRLAAGDLQTGPIAGDLEALGLMMDSPDAGGGRLILAPFSGSASDG